MISVQYSILSEILIEKKNLTEFFKQKFNVTDKLYDRIAKSKIDRFVQSHNRKFIKECRYNRKVFRSKNQLWLNRDLICPETTVESLVIAINSEGCPENVNTRKRRLLKPFQLCSDRTKRRRCATLRETANAIQIQQMFLSNLRKNNQTLDAKIVRQLLRVSPQRKIKILESIQKDTELTKYTADEALALYIDAKMTKHQYELVAHGAASRNSNIYPSYHRILDAKKQCYPPEQFIEITDYSVTVDLQALLDITSSRQVKQKIFSTIVLSIQHRVLSQRGTHFIKSH